MKTTEQIHQLYEMNNDGERDISKERYYTEYEILDALSILPCEELKDECLERLGIIRGLEE